MAGIVSKLTCNAVYSKDSRAGLLLDDEEACQYVCAGLKAWAEAHDPSYPDTTDFLEVRHDGGTIPNLSPL